jgi:glycosyltransferase involved in cell wall biosynthesis
MVHGWCPDAHVKLRGATLAVFNSEAARAEFDVGTDSIVVNPVTRAADHRCVPGDRVTLVNLSPDKGGEVFRLLALSFPDLGFLGVRGGYGRQELHMMPRNVEVIRMTASMRDDVWCRTRVLLMPSVRETWGMAGVEAMCSGIPVVAGDTPGLRESLGDGGFAFLRPEDLAGWQRAISALQDEVVWRDASARARARFDELDRRFLAGLDRFADAVEALCVSA